AVGAASADFCEIESAACSCTAVLSPFAGAVARGVRALRVPSHFGLLAAYLSFVAEPTSFAAQPKAPAAARTLAGWRPPLPPRDVSAWRSQTWFSARVARPTPHCAPLQPDPRS